jgi:hypothetical protein
MQRGSSYSKVKHARSGTALDIDVFCDFGKAVELYSLISLDSGSDESCWHLKHLELARRLFKELDLDLGDFVFGRRHVDQMWVVELLEGSVNVGYMSS